MQPVYSEVASKGLTTTKKYRFSHAQRRYSPSFVGVFVLANLSWADSVAILSSIHDKKDIFWSSINDKNIYLSNRILFQ